MKKIYLTSLLFGLLLANMSCEDIDKNEIYQQEFHKILYLKTTGVIDMTLYKTGEDTEYSFSIIKGGAFPELTADVSLKPMSAEELEEYCTPRGLNLERLPESCYTLSESDIHFGTEDMYKIINMSMHTTEIDKMPASNSDYVIPIMLKSDNDSINSTLNVLIIKPKVVVPAVAFTEKGVVTQYCPAGETTVEIPLQLQIENKWDFTCQVEALPTASGHEVLEKGYTLVNGGIVNFTKGSNTATLKVNINRTEAGLTEVSMDAPVIPLRLKSISIPTFDVDDNEILLEVSDKYPLTTDMLYTNAQEPSEGPIANLLDGSIATFFHSAWSIDIGEKHYVQVNLPQPLNDFIFSYTNRSSNGNAALAYFNVSVSANGTDFTSLKDFAWDTDELPGTAAGVYNSPKQTPSTPVKSIRFTCKSSWQGKAYFVWSEFSLYGF